MIECATNKKPLYIGKPERIMVDIVAGLNGGVAAVCVLTGEATVEGITQGEIKPDYTFQSVKELYEELVR